MRSRKPVAVRFWAKVVKSDGYWEWRGYRTKAGYGRLSGGGVSAFAHRLSWELHNGPAPDGMFVCHHCDNPPCVNPGHLFLGTHDDNMADMVAKGRQARGPGLPGKRVVGDRNGSRTRPDRRPRGEKHWLRRHPELSPRGECHGQALLTWQVVREIRELATSVSRTELARRYGVSRQAVSDVVHHKNWRET